MLFLFSCVDEQKKRLISQSLSQNNIDRITEIDHLIQKMNRRVEERGRKPIEVDILNNSRGINNYTINGIDDILNGEYLKIDSLQNYYGFFDSLFTEYDAKRLFNDEDSIRLCAILAIYRNNVNDSLIKELMIHELLSASSSYVKDAQIFYGAACFCLCCYSLGPEWKIDTLPNKKFRFTVLYTPNNEYDIRPNSLVYESFKAKSSINNLRIEQVGNGVVIRFECDSPEGSFISIDVYQEPIGSEQVQKRYKSLCPVSGHVGFK